MGPAGNARMWLTPESPDKFEPQTPGFYGGEDLFNIGPEPFLVISV